MSLADSDSLDLETRAHDREHDALRLWLRLLTCTNMIETDIRSRLRQEFDCTLPRFDLLAQLDRHPEGLKMGELSKRMMVTGGNVTGITDQLEKEGWVTRETVVNDRRAFLIKLTARGKKAFSNMARAHETWIEQRLGQLPEDRQHQLYMLLGDLKSVIG
ncbi:MarR family transcriptional regulator [Pandoraea communis]|uniref:MarR family transcriptional regulator n=1 Tax=Pandoraea communis TaxID=2508297 RepID=A0A5E4WD57_9BURK|nr:MarR family transcriptional regulator [Pandoraea communis]VVE21296.1 MarR family transcriptional regulator [Pandoraea communis]